MSSKDYSDFLDHTKESKSKTFRSQYRFMKPSLLDTGILSEFLRGNPKVITKVEVHLKEYGFIGLSIITYYQILNGLLYKDARK